MGELAESADSRMLHRAAQRGVFLVTLAAATALGRSVDEGLRQLVGTIGQVPDGVVWLLWPLVLAVAYGMAQTVAIPDRLSHWLAWLLATTSGLALGLVVLRAAESQIIYGGLGAVLYGTAGFILGCCVGGSQWLVLRRRFRKRHWWILQSGLAWCAFALLDQAGVLLTMRERMDKLFVELAPWIAGMVMGLALLRVAGETLDGGDSKIGWAASIVLLALVMSTIHVTAPSRTINIDDPVQVRWPRLEWRADRWASVAVLGLILVKAMRRKGDRGLTSGETGSMG